MQLPVWVAGLMGLALAAAGCGAPMASKSTKPAPSTPDQRAPTQSPTASRTATSSATVWTYETFTNHGPNGSFTVRIPQQFTAQAPPTDHDGRSWTHGAATITALTVTNAAHATMATLHPLNAHTTHITYRAQGPDWRVASGIDGSRIVYAKVYLMGQTLFWVTLTYPKADQSQYGPVVTHVADSFTPEPRPSGPLAMPDVLLPMAAGSSLHTPLGRVTASTLKTTDHPLVLKLSGHVLYQAQGHPWVKLSMWQARGPDVLCILSEPSVDQPATADHTFQDIVLNLRTGQVLRHETTYGGHATSYLTRAGDLVVSRWALDPHHTAIIIYTVQVVNLKTGAATSVTLPKNATGIGVYQNGAVYYPTFQGTPKIRSIPVTP